MKIRMVDYLIDEIYNAGAKHMFFVPGTGCMFLTDALARKNELVAVSMHHEQAAGMAALSYAKYNETIGACVVTTGCGGTNAVTALLHAWQDSVPCIFISGQASRNQTIRNCGLPLRQMGRQEADIISIVDCISKYAVMINDPEKVVYEIGKCIYEATHGRKGPVWIDVPMDIQNAMIDPQMQQIYVEPEGIDESLEDRDADFIFKELMHASRPVILAGNGIRLSGGVEAFNRFANSYGIPVTYSRLGHDLMETQNPLSIGMVGMLGASRAGNFALANSDLILCIGCRLSIDTTGYEYNKFARDAKLIVIDIDEVEHSKDTVSIDTYIHADAKNFFEKMNSNEPVKSYSEWNQKCLHWKEYFPVCEEKYKTGEKINMYYFTEALSAVLPEGATVLSDAGNTFFTVSPVIKVKKGQRSITSGGQAEMGYALPAAIGISYASKGPVIAITGDGSIMMNIQEFETIAFTKVPVKICIMNNNGYSSIRHLQNNAFRGREIGCDETSGISFPKFEKIASAFGLSYVRIEGSENLEEKIDKMLHMEGPVICEVMCVEKQEFLNVSSAFNSKKRLVTRPLEDQAPFIEREDFLREMIITPIDQ